jgi:hypothetical protein
MADDQEAILLTTLAGKWDTTAPALRQHILRFHHTGTRGAIPIVRGRITRSDYDRLYISYLKTRKH